MLADVVKIMLNKAKVEGSYRFTDYKNFKEYESFLKKNGIRFKISNLKVIGFPILLKNKLYEDLDKNELFLAIET